jgi:hypothetical protein
MNAPGEPAWRTQDAFILPETTTAQKRRGKLCHTGY